MVRSQLPLCVVGLAVAAASLAGCTGFQMPALPALPALPHIPFVDELPQYGRPNTLVAVWSDTVMTQIGKPATRGFGGRIYFYDNHNAPVAVDGELVVYAYDDTAAGPGGAPPHDIADRKYVFKREQLATHVSTSDIGVSYSVWIPWDKVGGDQRKVTLMGVFTGVDGLMIAGEQSRCVLPGKGVSEAEMAQRVGQFGSYPNQYPSMLLPPSSQPASAPQPGASQPGFAPPAGGVQPVSYQAALPPGVAPVDPSDVAANEGLKTSTFAVSSNLAHQLAGPGPEQPAAPQQTYGGPANMPPGPMVSPSIGPHQTTVSYGQRPAGFSGQQYMASPPAMQQPPGATPYQQSRRQELATHFAPRPRRAPGALTVPPAPGHAPTGPYPAGQPLAPGQQPGGGPAAPTPGSW